jgi:transcriptional regulator with XRE-family HTH domain
MNQHELKAERKKRKMTQAQFAELLGVKKGTVTAWERGQNPVPAWIQKRLNEQNKIALNPKVEISRYNALSEIAKEKGTDMDSIVAEALAEYIIRAGKTLLLFLAAHIGYFWLTGSNDWIGDGIASAINNGAKVISFAGDIISQLISQ